MLFIIFIVVKMRDLSKRQINHRKMDINHFWSCIIINLVKCSFGFFSFYFNFLHNLVSSQQNCKFFFRMDQTTFCICEPEGPGSRKKQEEILCMNATSGTHSALPPSDYEVQNAKYVLFVHRALKSSSSNLQPLFDQLVWPVEKQTSYSVAYWQHSILMQFWVWTCSLESVQNFKSG